MIELSARTAIAPKEDVVFSELDRIGTCFSVINNASQLLLPHVCAAIALVISFYLWGCAFAVMTNHL